MSAVIHALSVETFASMLRNLCGWLVKAGAQAEEGGGKTSADLAGARLAPDMFTLAEQVMLACQHAQNGAARLMGREPSGPETAAATLEAMAAQIAGVMAYLEAASPAAFDRAEARFVVIPVSETMELHMNGLQYLRDWALPHFYFHLVTAYDILRHEGVPVGKRDYLAHVGAHIRPAPVKTPSTSEARA